MKTSKITRSDSKKTLQSQYVTGEQLADSVDESDDEG